MPFFLVSALTKAFAEGNDWRKWKWGNWVGKRLRPWMQNKGPPPWHLRGVGVKGKVWVGPWRSGETASPHTPRPLTPRLQTMPSLWISDTTFLYLLSAQHFLLNMRVMHVLAPSPNEIRLLENRDSAYSMVPRGEPRSPKQLNACSLLEPKCVRPSVSAVVSQRRETSVRGKEVREDFL